MNTLTIMPLFIGTWELIVLAAIVLLLFGGKKIPELMRNLGKGVQEFKAGMSEVEKTLKDTKDPEKKEEESKVLEPDKIERTK